VLRGGVALAPPPAESGPLVAIDRERSFVTRATLGQTTVTAGFAWSY
jgi:hypothetical protein